MSICCLIGIKYPMLKRNVISGKPPVLVALIALVSLSVFYGLDDGWQEPYVPDSSRASEITFHGPESASVTFAVIGDYGDDSEAEARVAELVRVLEPDIVITTGDNNYPAGSAGTIDRNIGKYYSAYMHPYEGAYGKGSQDMNRFFPSIGNHDWPPDAHLDYFGLPGNERYYDFTWGPVHFFAVDTCQGEPDGTDADSTQARWLRRKLVASDSPFKFVYGHHPPYSSGKHGSSEEMRWPFNKWGADVYFAGHDHAYERLTVEGSHYFVVGLGGKSIYPFGRVIPESVFRYNDDYGALLVKVKEDRAIFRFYNIKGDIVDKFEIVR
jgi:hypothetical protein